MKVKKHILKTYTLLLIENITKQLGEIWLKANLKTNFSKRLVLNINQQNEG